MELIVAVAVGSIVAGAIASIIAISVRMYSKESVNVAEQYEIQTTLNQTVDSAESAQWFVLGEDKASGVVTNTKYVAFGKLTSVSGTLYFEGELFTDNYDPDNPGKFNIYMNRYSGTMLPVGTETGARTAIESEASSIRGQEKYLLGQGATKYIVSLDTASDRILEDSSAVLPIRRTSPTPTPTPTPQPAKGYYENPLTFNISIDFAKESMTGEVTKHVEDRVTLRNRVNKVLDIDGDFYVPKE